MSSQLSGAIMWQDQCLRVFQRVVCSINLGVIMCMFMILVFPANLEIEYSIPTIVTLRMFFWIMAVCCSVSLNCAGAVSAFLRARCRKGMCCLFRAIAILGTTYLSLVSSLAIVSVLFDKPVSLRVNLILCVLLMFYVMILYRFVEHSKYARKQRLEFLRGW